MEDMTHGGVKSVRSYKPKWWSIPMHSGYSLITIVHPHTMEEGEEGKMVSLFEMENEGGISPHGLNSVLLRFKYLVMNFGSHPNHSSNQ